MSDRLNDFLLAAKGNDDLWWTLNDLQRRELFEDALQRWKGLDEVVHAFGRNASLSPQERLEGIVTAAGAVARRQPAPERDPEVRGVVCGSRSTLESSKFPEDRPTGCGGRLPDRKEDRAAFEEANRVFTQVGVLLCRSCLLAVTA